MTQVVYGLGTDAFKNVNELVNAFMMCDICSCIDVSTKQDFDGLRRCNTCHIRAAYPSSFISHR